MKRMMKGAVIASLMLATWVWGGPFNAKLVSGDAIWAMHLDAETFRTSTLGKLMLQENQDAESLKQLKAFEEMFGMDPQTDLHAVTAYGAGIEPEASVILVNGKLNPAKLVQKVKTMPAYQLAKHGNREIHSWENEGEGAAERVYGVILDRNSAIIGQTLKSVKKAIDVADGKQKNLSQGGINTKPLSVGGVMMAVTADLSNVDLSANPMLAANNVSAKSVTIQVRESEGNFSIKAAVKQNSAQEAEQSLTLLNGMLGMVMMQTQQQNPPVADVMKAITIKRDNDALLLNVTYPATKLAALLKSAMREPVKTE